MLSKKGGIKHVEVVYSAAAEHAWQGLGTNLSKAQIKGTEGISYE